MIMNIRPTQKIVFINNKWWVWKTTLAYNVACKFADLWNKVLLVDADPQCNISLQAMWIMKYEDLWFFNENTIYHVFESLLLWTWDYKKIKPTTIRNSLDILPWNLNFSDFDDLLTTSYWEVIWSSSAQRWFTIVSAFQRYLNDISLSNNYNIVIIDASPSMTGSLNKTILMSSDFFITICNPDLFSKQWVINLWRKIKKRRDEQKNIINIADRAWNIPSSNVPKWEHTFLWYVLNNYNVYWEEPISTHNDRLDDIKPEVYTYLCELSKNGLVNASQEILWMTQDYWKISWVAQKKNIPMYEVLESDLQAQWSIKVLEKCKSEIDFLTENIAERLSKRWV